MTHKLARRRTGTPITRAGLSQFRAALPDCTLAVWSDVDAGLVLAADGDLLHPQEALDAICAAAARAMAYPPLDAGAGPDHVVVVGPAGGRLVLRDPALPSCALICLCTPDADLRRLLQAMAALLAAAGTATSPAGRTGDPR